MTFFPEFEQHLIWVERLTTDVVAHAPAPGPSTDAFRADLAGLLSTSYVAAFECFVKKIFTAFAISKHRILGNVASYHFKQINSKIHWSAIADVYAKQFGDQYRANFYRYLDEGEREVLRDHRQSLKQSYENLLKWRHSFAHEGVPLTTLEEVTSSYQISKRIILILDKAMST